MRKNEEEIVVKEVKTLTKRKLVSTIIAVVMCVSLSVTSYAESGKLDSNISVLNIIAKSYTSDLSISGTTATCTSRASGDDVKSITATQTLQKKSGSNWVAVSGANWTKTVSISMLTMSNTKTGLSSGTYRLKTVFKFTNTSGQSETITVYSDEKEI